MRRDLLKERDQRSWDVKVLLLIVNAIVETKYCTYSINIKVEAI